jgi:hypothetical protein
MFRPSALAACLTSTMKRPYEMPLLTFHWYIHVSVLMNLPETDKRNMRIRLKPHKNILAVVLYGCQT